MKYTLRDLGQGMLEQLTDGANTHVIAQWAHNVYLDPDTDTSSADVQKEIMRLVAMEEGPEFEYSPEELKELARGFIAGEGAGSM